MTKLDELKQIAETKHEELKERSAQVVKVIYFEDHGQDFLRWGVDASGNVMTCEPHQYWVWKNMQVCMEDLVEGELLHYRNKKTGKFRTIRYAVEKIEEVER